MHRRQTRTWRLLFRQKKNDEPAAERMSHTMPALVLHLVPSMEMCRQPIRFWRCTDSLSESGSGGWRRSQCTGVFPGSILWILLSAASASDVCTTGTTCTGSYVLLILPVLAVFRPPVLQHSQYSQYVRNVLGCSGVYSQYEVHWEHLWGGVDAVVRVKDVVVSGSKCVE